MSAPKINEYAERYTSYSTSLALREAGVAQGELQSPEGETFWRSYTSSYHEDPGKRLRCFEVRRPHATYSPGSVDGEPSDVDGMVRSFRLDELLELLEPLGTLTIEHAPPGDPWAVEITIGPTKCYPPRADARWYPSLVEAAAACLLAALRAREVSRG